MSSSRDIVAAAFRSWADGTGYVGSIFADDVLHPFGARFSRDDPFRPVNIRAIYDSIAFNELWDGVTP